MLSPRVALVAEDQRLAQALAARLRHHLEVPPLVGDAQRMRSYLGRDSDGLLVLEPVHAADVKMRIFNPDGSEAEMCGNGARCAGLYLKDGSRQRRGAVTIATQAGKVTATVSGNRVAIRMPDPRGLRVDLRVRVDHRPWQLTYIDTGVPHVVAVVDRLDRVDVERVGRQLRFHRAFHPRGTNVDFVEVDSGMPSQLRIRTYERGVEAETLACGTGVVAAAVIQALRPGRKAIGTAQRIEVETKSGERLTVRLAVRVAGKTRRVTDVFLEGAVRWVCRGVFPWPLKPAGASVTMPRTRSCG